MRCDKPIDDVSRINDACPEPPTKNIEHRTVAEIQMKVIKQSQRGVGSRLLHAKNDKEKIAAWKLDLNGILQIFNVHVLLSMFDYFSLFACRLS